MSADATDHSCPGRGRSLPQTGRSHQASRGLGRSDMFPYVYYSFVFIWCDYRASQLNVFWDYTDVGVCLFVINIDI